MRGPRLGKLRHLVSITWPDESTRDAAGQVVAADVDTATYSVDLLLFLSTEQHNLTVGCSVAITGFAAAGIADGTYIVSVVSNDHRFSLTGVVGTQTVVGGTYQKVDAIVEDVFAGIEWDGGEEFQASDQTRGRRKGRLLCRYLTHPIRGEVTDACTIIFNGRRFNCGSIVDVDERHWTLEMDIAELAEGAS